MLDDRSPTALRGWARAQYSRGVRRLCVLTLAFLLLAPSGASAATSAAGELGAPSGNEIALTVSDTGDTPIQCLRFTAAPGLRVLAVSTTVNAVTLTGPNDRTFGAQGLTLAPGSSIAFRLVTDQPYPPGAGGTLEVASSCGPAAQYVGFPVTGPPGGPVAPPAPPVVTPEAVPPEAEVLPPVMATPCRCWSFAAFGDLAPVVGRTRERNGTSELQTRLRLRLRCTGGTGGCQGTMRVRVPKGSDVRVLRPAAKVTCRSKCAGTTVRRVAFVLRGDGLDLAQRRNLRLPVTIQRVCNGRTLTAQKLVLVFDSGGRLMRPRSPTTAAAPFGA